jgi:hypothetical protein
LRGRREQKIDFDERGMASCGFGGALAEQVGDRSSQFEIEIEIAVGIERS